MMSKQILFNVLKKSKEREESVKAESLTLNHILSVGLELEGGYCYERVIPLLEKYGSKLHTRVVGDWSVQVSPSCEVHTGKRCWRDGKEIHAWVKTSDLPRLWGFVSDLWEAGFRQNSSCGNHIHITLDDEKKYGNFAKKNVWNAFKKDYLKAFKGGKYVYRLEHNGYCRPEWNKSIENCVTHPDYGYGKSLMINPNSVSEHGNLEFRPLPYFDNQLEAIKSYTKLLSIIDGMAT